MLRALLTSLFCTFAGLAAAHEVRPAIADLTVTEGRLELSVTLNAEALVAGADLEGVEDTNALDLSDEIDALRALPPEALAARLSEMRATVTERIGIEAGGKTVALSMTEISPGPVGNPELPRDTVLAFEGTLPAGADSLTVTWPADWGTVVLRQQGVEEPYTGYLSGGTPSEPIAIGGGGADSAGEAFLGYIPVGFEHILPMGLDHILFVLGLFFLSARLGALLWQVSAFTLAHTVTLALGGLGYVNVPGYIVEPIIAASIVFVAVENITSSGLSRWRPFVVFGFGLLHGLGFASVLVEFGLPQDQFIPALIGFNVGVELGQLAVIAIAFAVVFVALRVDALDYSERTGQVFYAVIALIFVVLTVLLRGSGMLSEFDVSAPIFLIPLAGLSLLCFLSASNVDKLEAYRTFVAVPASAAIALVGAYWFVERVFL
ncbi:HupE / UreJ protein [Roseivivax lentus]|uniref:HupE / UreJ protein n=1 Tax=Roseivivax lentus TaxID=633194 RepID=A0A1N7PVM7_9RHOB|nr:HupE/UreJ family protein [Roseivivax lentus]SIT14658.1 HupE / UreJ protein [Roseivivax lentus]